MLAIIFIFGYLFLIISAIIYVVKKKSNDQKYTEKLIRRVSLFLMIIIIVLLSINTVINYKQLLNVNLLYPSLIGIISLLIMFFGWLIIVKLIIKKIKIDMLAMLGIPQIIIFLCLSLLIFESLL